MLSSFALFLPRKGRLIELNARAPGLISRGFFEIRQPSLRKIWLDEPFVLDDVAGRHGGMGEAPSLGREASQTKVIG